MNDAMTELVENDGREGAKAVFEALAVNEAVDSRPNRGNRE